ncbi:MAG: hypothetical protein HZA48_04375 [Planctomycetes bacterium]|nr:hypothetical protein [Planctomycetota bacterium]
MKKTLIKNNKKKEKQLLVFLKKTREGQYAKIDRDSLKYLRVKEERSDIIDLLPETYFYSIG